MLHIDEARVFAEIEARKPRAVALQGPDGLLAAVQSLAGKITERCAIPAFIIGDPCYGSCDLAADQDIERLGADLAFNIGHTIALDQLGKRTIMVDAWDDVAFDGVLAKAVPILRPLAPVGLVTTSQHLHILEPARAYLTEQDVPTIIGRGQGQLKDGQVFGCEFYPAYNVREQVQAFALLGQSPFHAIGVALATGKRTFMLDPYYGEVSDVQQLAEERWKRAVLAVHRARDVGAFGVIVGLKEGQMTVQRALDLKARLEAHGKQVQLVAMREITPERLAQFPHLGAFVQTACPRIATDGYTFAKPVLSVPQAQALLDLLAGKAATSFLERSHWL
jgi:2-(3-amino-3-carboxypropyl)histidine synthase